MQQIVMDWLHTILHILQTKSKLVSLVVPSIDFNVTNSYGMTLFHFVVSAYSFRILAIVDFYDASVEVEETK